ncbi:gamma-glutamyl-gamma-aminobutyrate hydrolase family protein [Amycolatopsis sp.]|uniref:gamma-glutamyl-gamma-aminobutyrate hydrolase family protein n=1 Tax=Amycolatopsis sp. TaxID=37632 RepID=UPI002C0D2E2A|nr:gamma-glutamyl-gamma-aminobutyrate hydrolase family protein [Amycolatopsis sp.]HVV13127.1 gamma-glutamyl-gamma-aminobutyrate hydrolase family protein [Amycolatopsis sp.]
MTRPDVVGVTQRVVDCAHGETRLALDVRWAGFLDACGLVAVPLPLDPELAVRTMRRTGCGGLVLTGGDSIGSRPARDHLETELLRFAVDNALPVVGVCRGMQLLLHAFGCELRRVEGHTATTHPLTGLLGGRVVNSFHDWSVLNAPPEFEVTARHGAVVEAVRHRAAPLTGIMWHPERAAVAAEDVALFEEALTG